MDTMYADTHARPTSRGRYAASMALLLALTGCPEDDAVDVDDVGDAEAEMGDGSTQTKGDAGDSHGDGGESDASASGPDAGTSAAGDAGQSEGDGGETSTDFVRPFMGNGIAAKLDGEDIAFTMNVAMLPDNTGTGMLMLQAYDANPLVKWSLFVPAMEGTYSCGDGVEETVLQLIDAVTPSRSSGGSGDGSCTVHVLKADDDVYYGTFEGQLRGAIGDPLKTLSDGYFYYAVYDGPTGGNGLAAGEQGASFVLNGERWTYDGASSFAFETYAGMTAAPTNRRSPGFPVGLQIHSVPNAVGSYACAEGASYRALNVWFTWKGQSYSAGSRQSANPAGPAGSRCGIEVSSVGTLSGNSYTGTFAGSFEGTFVTNDGAKSLTITDGEFRLVGGM